MLLSVLLLLALAATAQSFIGTPSSRAADSRLETQLHVASPPVSQLDAFDALAPRVQSQKPRCVVLDTSDELTPYADAWEQQKQILEHRLSPAGQHDPDCIMLVQHPAVLTLGTGSTLGHLKFDAEQPPFDIFRVERGGEVTYHGPGQVIRRCSVMYYMIVRCCNY
jgi:hypothetical protein